MEFKTLAAIILAVVVLMILILLAVNVSGTLEGQVSNATGLIKL